MRQNNEMMVDIPMTEREIGALAGMIDVAVKQEGVRSVADAAHLMSLLQTGLGALNEQKKQNAIAQEVQKNKAARKRAAVKKKEPVNNV